MESRCGSDSKLREWCLTSVNPSRVLGESARILAWRRRGHAVSLSDQAFRAAKRASQRLSFQGRAAERHSSPSGNAGRDRAEPHLFACFALQNEGVQKPRRARRRDAETARGPSSLSGGGERQTRGTGNSFLIRLFLQRPPVRRRRARAESSSSSPEMTTLSQALAFGSLSRKCRAHRAIRSFCPSRKEHSRMGSRSLAGA